jgi:drug/metabolite transporter (DMT)-like permease
LPPSPPRPLWLLLAFAYIYVAWGATYLAIHLTLDGIPPLVMTACRFLLAGPILFALLRLHRARDFHWGNAREWKDAAIIGTLLLVGGNGVIAWAQQFVPSGLTALIFGSIPFWIILFDWIGPAHAVPSRRTWVGLVLGLVGVVVLVGPDTGRKQASPFLFAGELVLLLSACSWAAGAIYSRHVEARGSPLLPMARQMIMGGTINLGGSLVLGEWAHFSLARVTLQAWLGFAYLVVFGSLVGFTVYVWLMRVSTPTRVATISYANLAVAVLLGWAVLGEPFTARLLWGSVILISAIVLVLRKPKQPADIPGD